MKVGVNRYCNSTPGNKSIMRLVKRSGKDALRRKLTEMSQMSSKKSRSNNISHNAQIKTLVLRKTAQLSSGKEGKVCAVLGGKSRRNSLQGGSGAGANGKVKIRSHNVLKKSIELTGKGHSLRTKVPKEVQDLIIATVTNKEQKVMWMRVWEQF